MSVKTFNKTKPEPQPDLAQESNERIAVIGTLPPPFGGVSVHIDRKLSLLAERGVPYRLYEQSGKSIPGRNVVSCRAGAAAFLKLLFRMPERLIHFHTNRLDALAIASVVLKLRHKRYMITVHSEKPIRKYKSGNWVTRQLIRRCFRNASHLICVNPNIQDFVCQMGVPKTRTSLIPAYLPPTEAELNPENIPSDVSEFVNRFDRVIGTHGWFGYFVEGVHLYSFDHLLRLAEHLKNNAPSTGMYTIISGVYENEDWHRDQILKLRAEKKLEDQWMIIESQFCAAPLFNRTSVFIRPTLTDGDSVSIRECLDLGIPVLASDAVNRPPGCFTFPKRDYEKMLDKLNELLDPDFQKPVHDPKCPFADELIKVIQTQFDETYHS